MNRKLNSKSVRGAVWGVLEGPVDMAVNEAVEWSVHGAVDQVVGMAVYGAADEAVEGAARSNPPHPNLQRFIGEIRQARWGAA